MRDSGSPAGLLSSVQRSRRSPFAPAILLIEACEHDNTPSVLACFSIPAAAAAQANAPSGSAPGHIAGVVVNTRTEQPITVAAVAIRNAGDSALVGGGFTRANGRFQVEVVRPGVYTVRVRVLGFAPVVKQDVSVTPAAMTVDVDQRSLTPIWVELSAIAVTAERSDVAVAPDRTEYNVGDMPSSSGGNAVNVLRNLPSVEACPIYNPDTSSAG